MELWDVYDEYRNKTGKIVARDESRKVLEEGEYGLIVHVIIFNSNHEMLIQKRQATKSKFPNLWDVSAGGHSVAGEDSQETVERELFEELGYRYDFSNEIPYFSINSDDSFDDVYVIRDLDIDIDELKIQAEEVQSVIWASKEEVLQLIEEKKFIPYNPGFIELLFYQNYKRGVVED